MKWQNASAPPKDNQGKLRVADKAKGGKSAPSKGNIGSLKVAKPAAKKLGATGLDATGDQAYQAKADMHTLLEAHKIKGDKKRHTQARAVMVKHLSAMKAALNDHDGDEGSMESYPQGGV